jgi:hypothetical protein
MFSVPAANVSHWRRVVMRRFACPATPRAEIQIETLPDLRQFRGVGARKPLILFTEIDCGGDNVVPRSR